MHIQRAAKHLGRLHSLELLFLDVAAAIVVQDAKDLLHFLGTLLGEAADLEKLLGAEGVRCCERKQRAESATRDGSRSRSLLCFHLFLFLVICGMI